MPRATAAAVSSAPKRARPDGANRQQPEVAHRSSLASLPTRTDGSGIASGACARVAQCDVVDHLAVAHDQDPVGVRRDPRVVGDQHRRLMLLTAQTRQQRHHLVPARPVEVSGRLVGEQERRRRGERPGQRDPLLLSTGDLLGAVALEAMEVELIHQRVDAVADHLPGELLPVASRRLVAQPKRQCDVLGRGQSRKEVEKLEDKADVVAPER